MFHVKQWSWAPMLLSDPNLIPALINAAIVFGCVALVIRKMKQGVW